MLRRDRRGRRGRGDSGHSDDAENGSRRQGHAGDEAVPSVGALHWFSLLLDRSRVFPEGASYGVPVVQTCDPPVPPLKTTVRVVDDTAHLPHLAAPVTATGR